MINARRIAAFSLLCVIWGTSWVAFSELEGHCPPFRAAAIRYGVAAFLVLITAVAKRQPVAREKPLRSMLILGVTMVALPFALLLWGGRVVPAATTAVLFALAPIALVLISSAGSGVPAPRRVFYATWAGSARSSWRCRGHCPFRRLISPD
jgi:putative membrane protein PagO